MQRFANNPLVYRGPDSSSLIAEMTYTIDKMDYDVVIRLTEPAFVFDDEEEPLLDISIRADITSDRDTYLKLCEVAFELAGAMKVNLTLSRFTSYLLRSRLTAPKTIPKDVDPDMFIRAHQSFGWTAEDRQAIEGLMGLLFSHFEERFNALGGVSFR